ncbi:MAG: hypothetical protein ACWA5L_08840 [bacterium]
MADGFHEKSTGFIAYQDEEHGLGHQVAQKLGEQMQRTSPRRTSGETLATLISRQASAAVVPIENDLGGYNRETLAALMDFSGYRVAGAHSASDNYVLAVPAAQVHELGESAFPSSFKDRRGAIGNMPINEAMRNMLRNRIGRVYASPDALDRCAPALDGLAAQGIEISRLPEHVNPYRTVLEEALGGLDPKRMVTTKLDDKSGKLERLSQSSGKNFAKSLSAVLLPANSVFLGMAQDNKDHEGAEYHDYVLVDNRLEGNQNISTRFLVIERRDPLEKETLRSLSSEDRFFASKGSDLPTTVSKNPYARLLLAVNSRGKKTANVNELTDFMARRRLAYTPVVVNDRPDVLPIIYEIELRPEQLKDVKDLVSLAFRADKNWQAKLLGDYPSDGSLIENYEFPAAAAAMPSWGWAIIGAIFFIAGVAATLKFIG